MIAARVTYTTFFSRTFASTVLHECYNRIKHAWLLSWAPNNSQFSRRALFRCSIYYMYPFQVNNSTRDFMRSFLSQILRLKVELT